MVKRHLRWLPAVLGAIALASFAAIPAGASGPKSVNTTPSVVEGSGSDTTYNMMVGLDTLYNGSAGCAVIAPQGQPQPLDFSCLQPDPPDTITTEDYAHDQIREAYPLGSGNGQKQLCGFSGSPPNGDPLHVDFARSSSATNQCAGENFVAYARDGISWECFPGVAGSGCASISNLNLTQQQIKDIWLNCTITNWSQLGGDNVPIHVYTAQAGSGTRSAWDGFVGGDTSHCVSGPDHIIFENENTAIFNNGDAANAIFFFSFGRYNHDIVPHPDGSSLGAVDGISMTYKTIQNGSFPFGRFLFNVYCTASCSSGPSSAAAVKYVGETGWICKLTTNHSIDPVTGKNYGDEIRKVIKAQGFVALSKGNIGGGVPGKDYCRLTVH